MIPDWWQAEINRWGGGFQGAPAFPGFSTVNAAGIAAQRSLVESGKTWYVYPDSGVSQTGGGVGAEGPYTLAEARNRQSQIRSNPTRTTTQTTATGPVNTPADAINEAAENLSSASEAPVPNFIQPYQPVSRGFGAYGERDIF